MGELLIVLALTATVCLVSTLATAGVLVWTLRRRNRVVRNVRSSAPLAWLCSPVAPARLHRRLRRAVLAAEAAARRDHSGAVGDLTSQLAVEALLVDAELVRIGGLPRHARRRSLTAAARRTVTIEASAVRLSSLTSPSAQHAAVRPSGAERLTERVDLLEAAYADVERLEHDLQNARAVVGAGAVGQRR
jgi:hypothetical protein